MRIPPDAIRVKPGRYVAGGWDWKVSAGHLWSQAEATRGSSSFRLRATSFLTSDFPHAEIWLSGRPMQRLVDDSIGMEAGMRTLTEAAFAALAAAAEAKRAYARDRRANAKKA
jgi:hypothetical protein